MNNLLNKKVNKYELKTAYTVTDQYLIKANIYNSDSSIDIDFIVNFDKFKLLDFREILQSQNGIEVLDDYKRDVLDYV